jgi:hypothetical protein
MSKDLIEPEVEISYEESHELQNRMIENLKKTVQKGGNDCLQKFDSFGGSNQESSLSN